jgi:hypothetical protein
LIEFLTRAINRHETVLKEKRSIKIAENEKIMKLEPGFPVFREAVPAIYRPALGWLKGYFAFLPTV